MRQDTGRSIANVIDVFGAIGERSVDVAGVKRGEVIANALLQNLDNPIAVAPVRHSSLPCGYRRAAPPRRASKYPVRSFTVSDSANLEK